MNQSISTRREFLQKGLGLLVAGATAPMFLEQTVWALSDPEDSPRTQRPSGKDGTILVVVQLGGGNDGLSMVVPYADDAYHRVRPTIGIEAKSVLKLDDYVSLHPELLSVKSLFDEGKMALVQGVGYPNPNRSHFRSMDIWQSGVPEKEVVTSGWLGRYFDNTCSGIDPHAGVSIGGAMPLAMKGERITPLAFDRPESYRYNGPDRGRYVALNEGSGLAGSSGSETVKASSLEVAHPTVEGKANIEHRTSNTEHRTDKVNPHANLDFLHRTAMDAQLSSDEILRITSRYRTTAQYPNGEFGNGLRTVAAMIAGGLPTRVYYVSLGGFDTHAGQRGRHDQLMKQLGQGLGAFWADMKEQKNGDRVLMMTFSEFGRRVEQNASAGTDHGAAAPMFLLGGGLKERVVGRHPSLTDLDHGDLKFGIDFRSVYAAILQDWLGTPSKPVLGQSFPPISVFRRR